MGNKENQEQSEFLMLSRAMDVARAKGGEARRNVDRISGSREAFGEPDILLHVGQGQIIGIEHFRVDQVIGHGKKKESKAARFSGDAERFRKGYENEVQAGNLPEEAKRGLGKFLSKAIKEQHNSCIHDVAESLEAGLFGEEGRGHAPKLATYRSHVLKGYSASDVQLGFLIEFHTNAQGWFLNEGSKIRKIRSGEFPVSEEVYKLLKKASRDVDWLMLAFCPALSCEVVDAAVVDCRRGKFETSLCRQGFVRTEYLGLGKDKPFGKQKVQGRTKSTITERDVQYLIENTSEPIDGKELYHNAMMGAARALNLSRGSRPFAASLSVQLVFDIVKDAFKKRHGPFDSNQVCNVLRGMPALERTLRIEEFGRHWVADVS